LDSAFLAEPESDDFESDDFESDDFESEDFESPFESDDEALSYADPLFLRP
jgi:hypothetical protein